MKQDPVESRLAHKLCNIDDKIHRVAEKLWLVYRNPVEIFLFLTNFLIAFKTSANLLALINGSPTLLVDYNGALDYNPCFTFSFIFLNVGLLLTSIVCLMALLLFNGNGRACTPASGGILFRRGNIRIKARLIKCFTYLHVVLALFALLLSARLWFVPFKLELDENQWLRYIRTYHHQFVAGAEDLLPGGYSSTGEIDNENLVWLPGGPQGRPSVELLNKVPVPEYRQSYRYTHQVDRLQSSLGCCGYWHPNDYITENPTALLAPSCCSSPVRLDTNYINFKILRLQIVPYFHCRQPLQHERLGCQPMLMLKQNNFLFHLRLTLLLLLAHNFVSILASAYWLNRVRYNYTSDSSPCLAPQDSIIDVRNNTLQSSTQAININRPLEHKLVETLRADKTVLTIK